MPTDYACQTAAERAAHCLTPVCAALAPDERVSSAEAEVMPVVLRNYLGAAAPAAPATHRRRPQAVGVTTGAAVLRLCLDGLRAEMEGSLAQWHTSLTQQLPEVLRQGRTSKPHWEALQELQYGAQEVLTQLARRDRSGPGARELGGQVALLEDVLSGALRRLSVPSEPAAACAAGLAAAVASLFGLVVSPAEH